MGEQSVQQCQREEVLPLIEKYFEWVGIFEDGVSNLVTIRSWRSTSDGSLDTLYVPSSQEDEIMNDEGLHKELRYYCVGQSDNVRFVRWRLDWISSSWWWILSSVLSVYLLQYYHHNCYWKSTRMSTMISVRSPADFHVHLRQGSISNLITPHVRKGGFDLAYVMVR